VSDEAPALRYRFPVFLSYRRNDYFDSFFQRVHFHLEGQITQHLGGEFNPCEVFRDVKYNGTGSESPFHFAQALAGSAVMVALIAPLYYGPESPWTVAEIDHMRWRSGSTKCATPLIFPILMTDGDLSLLPEDVRKILWTDLGSLADGNLKQNTRDDAELRSKIRGLAPRIAQAVKSAPAPDRTWSDRAEATLGPAWQHRDASSTSRQQELLRLGDRVP